MKSPYLLLSQPAREAHVSYHSGGYVEMLFRGGRVAAKKFLRNLRLESDWRRVPTYCEKRARRGQPSSFVKIP